MSIPVMPLPNEEAQDYVLPRRTPWWRRRRTIILAGVVVVLLVLLLVLPALMRPRQPTYQFEKATQGNLDLTVNATGPIQTGTYNVVFSGSGKISEIDTKVGQSVKKGDVLAKLDKTSLQDALNEAQASLLSSQSSLDTAQNNYSKTQAQSQASVDSAQTTLNNAQQTLTKTQAQSQSSIDAALQSLSDDQTALTNTQKESQASIDAAQTSLSNDQTALTNTKNQDQANINAAQQTLTNAQATLTKTQTQTDAQIQVAKDQETQSLNACQTAATPTANCQQTAIDTYNQSVAQAQASLTSAQNSVNSAQQSLSTAQAQATTDNASAQAKVATDQKSLQTAQTQGQANNASAQAKINTDQTSLNTSRTNSSANNTSAQNAVTSAQASLKSAQAQAATNDTSSQGQVVSAQSQFNTSQTQLDTAKHNLENATLLAPHDGIVTAVNGTVGGTPGVAVNSSSTAAATDSTFIKLIDTSSLQVQANVNESDTGNLKVGLPAQFTVSAFGDKIFHGTVSAISPNGQSSSNVVTYPVTIDVDMKSLRGSNLLPNMTANTTITVVHHPNVILISVSAINFARSAATTSTTSSGSNAPGPFAGPGGSQTQQSLISKNAANVALSQARQRVLELQNAHPDGSMDSVTPAYVIERQGNSFVVKPVVLGLTDETVYEVIDGLEAGESVLVGVQR